ncbi:MAG: N-acetylglucosamine-6-phosphate deacetylase [Actinomycetota bacterium]
MSADGPPIDPPPTISPATDSTDPAGSTLTIAGGRLLPDTGDGPGPTDVRLTGDHIATVEASAPAEGPTFDARGLFVAPGSIDLQINGGHGIDLWSDPGGLWELARRLPRHGVTSFCPTIVSGPPERVDAARRALSERPGDGAGRAEPLGLHLEGPMLAEDRRGAHDRRHLRAADVELVSDWSLDGGVRLVTLAPELPGALDVIAHLRSRGVTVAAGHTEATAEQAATAEAAGVAMVTHLFNAMAPLHHRDPGLLGHVLAGGELVAGLIADGIHVDPTVVAVAARALLPDRLVLVSDAVAAMGLPAGTHRFGDREVVSDPEGVRRPDGTLAGSNLTLDAAVRNLRSFTGCSAADAVRCATANPARVLGVDDERGRLAPGTLADLTLLDAELKVVATVCRGRLAHVAPTAAWRLSEALEPPSGPG